MSKPPVTLYHYTTQAGLLGILSSNSIWATKIHYLNDSTEYQLALDICNKHLEALLKGERSTKKKTKIKTLQSNLRMISRMNVCVASFSVHDDLLSQWRAYASSSTGFCIGFNTAELTKVIEPQGFRLARCIYDAKQHGALIEELVTSSLSQDFNTIGTTVDPVRPRTLIVHPTGGEFAMKFAQLAAELKSNAFFEESEWRLVSTNGISVMRMSFRPGVSMLIPYVPLAFGDAHNSIIETVTVGPTPHPELSEESVRSLLAQQNRRKQVNVRVSKAPYRAW